MNAPRSPRALVAGAIALLLASACPTPPPDSAPASPPGQAGPSAPGGGPASGGNPPPAAPSAGGTDPGAAMPPAPAVGVQPGQAPSFAKLIGDGDTVTVRVTVTGATSGRIDLQTLETVDGHVQVQALHQVAFSGPGAVEIEAPAKYDKPIYVSAEDTSHDRIEVGGARQPLKLAGEDVAVTVKIGEKPAWLVEMMPEPVEPRVDAPEGVPAPGGAPPPAGSPAAPNP